MARVQFLPSVEYQTSFLREPSFPPMTHILPSKATEVWKYLPDQGAEEVARVQVEPPGEDEASFTSPGLLTVSTSTRVPPSKSARVVWTHFWGTPSLRMLRVHSDGLEMSAVIRVLSTDGSKVSGVALSSVISGGGMCTVTVFSASPLRPARSTASTRMV